MSNFFQIGIIVRPQGVQGEVRVLPTTDDPERFSLLDKVFVCRGEVKEAYAVRASRVYKGMVYLRLGRVDDRAAAEALVGATLQIPPEKALPLDADEYYIRDLIGLAVYTEEGENLGSLREVLHTGANDVYVIAMPGGKELLLPAIKSCILSVSPAQRKIVARVPEGLRP